MRLASRQKMSVTKSQCFRFEVFRACMKSETKSGFREKLVKVSQVIGKIFWVGGRILVGIQKKKGAKFLKGKEISFSFNDKMSSTNIIIINKKYSFKKKIQSMVQVVKHDFGEAFLVRLIKVDHCYPIF